MGNDCEAHLSSSKRGWISFSSRFHLSDLPRNTIPIACAFSRGNEMVAYVDPLSAAKPESSDCAGDIARSTEIQMNK